MIGAPSTAAEKNLDDFVGRFEAQTLTKQEWNHAAHLRVAGYYVLALGEAAALEKLRVGIRQLNEAHGVANSDCSGYHETLTCFWVVLIRRFFRGYQSGNLDSKRASMIETLVATFGRRSWIYREYWSGDIAGSVEARKSWVAADLIPVDVSGLALQGGHL
jgi:hypothetical protein